MKTKFWLVALLLFLGGCVQPSLSLQQVYEQGNVVICSYEENIVYENQTMLVNATLTFAEDYFKRTLIANNGDKYEVFIAENQEIQTLQKDNVFIQIDQTLIPDTCDWVVREINQSDMINVSLQLNVNQLEYLLQVEQRNITCEVSTKPTQQIQGQICEWEEVLLRAVII